MLVEKPLIGQKVIAPYMKDANNHTLFTMKDIEMKFGRDVYGERMHIPTRFEPDRGVDHDKIILLSTPFPTIPILGKNCCCGVIVFYVGYKRCCIVLNCIVLYKKNRSYGR